MPKRPAKKPTRKATRRAAKAGPALTPKQARFVDEYLVDLNGKQAAIRAGYASGSAEVTASKLLRNAKVKALVQVELEERQERTMITQDRVLEELQRLAFSNVSDYVLTDEGQVKLAEGADEEAMRAVSSIKRRTKKYTYADGSESVTHDVELKLWNKPEPLKLAGRHTGLFPNEVKVDMGEGTLADILKMAHEFSRAGQ